MDEQEAMKRLEDVDHIGVESVRVGAETVELELNDESRASQNYHPAELAQVLTLDCVFDARVDNGSVYVEMMETL